MKADTLVCTLDDITHDLNNQRWIWNQRHLNPGLLQVSYAGLVCLLPFKRNLLLLGFSELGWCSQDASCLIRHVLIHQGDHLTRIATSRCPCEQKYSFALDLLYGCSLSLTPCSYSSYNSKPEMLKMDPVRVKLKHAFDWLTQVLDWCLQKERRLFDKYAVAWSGLRGNQLYATRNIRWDVRTSRTGYDNVHIDDLAKSLRWMLDLDQIEQICLIDYRSHIICRRG